MKKLEDALKEGLITEAEYWEGVTLAWQVHDIALEDAHKKLEEKLGRYAKRRYDL